MRIRTHIQNVDPDPGLERAIQHITGRKYGKVSAIWRCFLSFLLFSCPSGSRSTFVMHVRIQISIQNELLDPDPHSEWVLEYSFQMCAVS
jgi:hypothetical protein